MFKIIKKLIEQIVDRKDQLSKLLVTILIFLFPLNQQYHFRTFPSVDGHLIDYLILKVSVVELLLFALILINLKEVYLILLSYLKNFYFLSFLILILNSTLLSKYIWVSLYENLILVSIFITGVYLYKNQRLLDPIHLKRSIIFWIIFLSILAFLQFTFQKSIFNNYFLTGEFPYTQDYYHIKQKSLFFENLIPPYGIFSHSNILGSYLIFLLIFLNLLKADKKVFYYVVLIDLILIGSSVCLLAFFIFIFINQIKSRYLLTTSLNVFVTLILAGYFLYSYKYLDFNSDFSVYRRLYMFDLSSNLFIEDPKLLLFGSGYYNYFNYVKDFLYDYELVRFFNPLISLPSY